MSEISTIKKRILQYLDSKGITKYRFYKTTGISNGTLDNTSGFNEENILKIISHYRDINLIWLLTGKGEMIQNYDGNNTVNELKDTEYVYNCTDCKEKDARIAELNDMVLFLRNQIEDIKKDKELYRRLLEGNDSINKQAG